MTAPAAPASAQMTKPARRPMRRIISEIGKVVSAVPTIDSAMGSVAHEGLGASVEPTRPAVTTSAVDVAPKIAWDMARIIALRRAFASSKARASSVTR